MHLCFSITAHGFGHGAISTSIIARLMQFHPEIKITIVTLLPKSYLASRLSGAFTHVKLGHDFGMIMHSANVVDVPNSRDAYQQLLENWAQYVSEEMNVLQAFKPDWVISNISPITLDAAQQLNIRTASVAPFNWAQIYERYCLDKKYAHTETLYRKMLAVYRKVEYTYKPQPSVPFTGVKEIDIASINNQPTDHIEDLIRYLPKGTNRVALVALGGLPFDLDIKHWPTIPGLHWLLNQPGKVLRDDMSQINELKFSFLQLVGSCDLIITKPGYGTYCEIAAIAQNKKIRVLSLARQDWPETPYLNSFLASRVPFLEIHESALKGQALTHIITQLNGLDYPKTEICEDGAMQLITHLLSNGAA
ncbi:hypothetical protein [Psychromonas sp. MME2]|uniref:hypothetical protein n=1 Tax=unclassified Psychromonas TaxID=2614957 RepID=UPI00339C7B89